MRPHRSGVERYRNEPVVLLLRERLVLRAIAVPRRKVTVHHAMKIVCSNRAADAELRLKVNKRALHGMDTRVSSLARRVGNASSSGCDVRR
jgi:hypothetical protein